MVVGGRKDLPFALETAAPNCPLAETISYLGRANPLKENRSLRKDDRCWASPNDLDDLNSSIHIKKHHQGKSGGMHW